MNDNSFIMNTEEGIILTISVKPNSKKQSIDLDINFLTISLKSQPEKGKANKELLKYLSKILDIHISKIQLISGQTSRDKKILVNGLEIDEIKERIERNLNEK